jgi:hypothetical protein
MRPEFWGVAFQYRKVYPTTPLGTKALEAMKVKSHGIIRRA